MFDLVKNFFVHYSDYSFDLIDNFLKTIKLIGHGMIQFQDCLIGLEIISKQSGLIGK